MKYNKLQFNKKGAFSGSFNFIAYNFRYFAFGIACYYKEK